MRLGSLIPLRMEEALVSYGRVYETERIVVLIHTGEEERETEIPVWLLGGAEAAAARRILFTDESGYNVGETSVELKNGMLELTLSPHSAAIFVLDL